jgi:formylglycine-generating enzyme required for sulfatase activity
MTIRDYVDGMDVRKGYNSLTGAISPAYVTKGNLVPAGGKTGQTAELLFKRVTSSSELSEVLGINAEANLNASWFQASGSIKAKAFSESSAKINQYSTFSVLYVKVTGATENLEDVDLIPAAQDFIKKNGLDAFYQKAGYEYISGIISGGEFISVIEIVSSDIQTKEKIDAELSAQIAYSTVVPNVGSINADAKLTTAFQKLASYQNVSIEARCYRKGGMGALVTSPDEALKYAVNFPASVRDSASILQVLCSPYDSLLSFPGIAIDLMVVQRQQRVLQGIWNRYQQISQSITQIDYILLHPLQFEGVQADDLSKGKMLLERQLLEIEEKAMQYARSPKALRVDATDFPAIPLALPTRHRIEDFVELVNISAGSFRMGSGIQSREQEQPIHTVNLKAFRMSKYPITQKQYMAVMGVNPSHFTGDKNCPVESVSWHDAVKFCEKLSTMTGQTVKLPTEAQWEYACRAGSAGIYCFGDDENQLENYAWYEKNSDKKTHPVGQKRSNNWGLHDMHGNVLEWCEDSWHENYNSAPSDDRVWDTGGDHLLRVRRGGSWLSAALFCRSTVRRRNDTDGRNNRIGFRVVV